MINNPCIPGDGEEFIQANLPLVHYVCRKYISTSHMLSSGILSYDDLVSIGSIGLVKAYQKFDNINFNVKFSTYATPMIIGEIRRYLRDNVQGVKFPRRCKDVSYAIKKANLLHEKPELIAKILNISLKEVEGGLEYCKFSYTDHLDRVLNIGSDGIDITVGSRLVDNTFMELDNKVILDDFMSNLSTKEIKIFNLWSEGKRQIVIAEEVGITQVQVSRIIKKIFLKAEEYGKGKKILREGESIMVEESERGRGKTRGIGKEIRSLLKDGVSPTEIAKKFNCSMGTVNYHKKCICADDIDDRIKEAINTGEMVSNNSNSECITRPMTEEEKIKYGKSRVKEILEVKETPKTEEIRETAQIIPELKLTEKVVSETTDKVAASKESIDTTEKISKIKNVNMSLDLENIDHEEAQENFKKILYALKFLDLKKFNLRLDIEGND